MTTKLIQLLESKRIEYKDVGGDLIIKCLNPEHEDNSPSLRVHPETGAMHCFACSFKGNLFTYLNSEEFRDPSILYKVKNKIKKLQQSSVYGNSYLTIPSSAMPIDFSEPYRGISNSLYNKYNAFTQEKDFEGRLVFPITDSIGNIIVFQGRSMINESPKYMLKPKGVTLPIFPLRKNSPVIILVEGIFDMLNLEENGIDNAICCFGSSQFSSDNVADKLLYQIISGTKIVIILFDNDTAGNKGAEKLEKLITEKTNLVPIIGNFLLPKDKDAGDLTKEEIKSLKTKIKILIDEYRKN